MKEFWLRLLGVRSADGELMRLHIRFANLRTPFYGLLFLLAAGALAYAVWWFYKREPEYCRMWRRRTLAALRYAGLLVLLLIIAGPVLEMTVAGKMRGKVVVLIDNSKSMSRIDKYRRPEDKLAVAHVLGSQPLTVTDGRRVGPESEKEMAALTRMDLVRAIFANKEFDFLNQLQKHYEVEMWSFARAGDMKRLEAAAPKLDSSVLNGVAPDGVATEIGGSLRKALDRLKGQLVSGIVLVTDGGNNKGEDPLAVAQELETRIFPIGIGAPETRHVGVANVFMDAKLFMDDITSIAVLLHQHGFSGEPVQLTVSSAGEVLDQQSVQLQNASEQVARLRVKPKKLGKFTYKIEVQPLAPAAEDSDPGNNFKLREVEVIDQKLNVLLVEAEPRWEYRYLKNALTRDKRFNLKILLRVPEMNELHKGNPMFLTEFPGAAELLKFHAIVFGNLANDSFLKAQDLENLRRFVVEEGGGIWFIAGKNNFPDTFKDSKLEQLLPVEFEHLPEITGEDEKTRPLTTPYRAMVTPEGKTNSVTRLETLATYGNEEKSGELWSQLPPFYWFHRAIRVKLGARPLLVCAEENSGAGQHDEPAPLLVVQQIGRGMVLYQAFDNLWRMRYPLELGPDALDRFHGHVIRYLGMAKLLGRTARVEISTDKEEYSVGDPVTIRARVLTKRELRDSTADHVTAVISETENEANQTMVELTPEPGIPGVFRGQKVADATGKFRVTLKEESEEPAYADFKVVIPQVEMDDPEMKQEFLDVLAKISCKNNQPGLKPGMYFPDQVAALLKDLMQTERPVLERKENTLWDAPIWLLAFTLFMGAEWLLRKRGDLL